MAHTPAHYPDLVKIYAHPLLRVYAIFLFAIEYSAKAQHTTTGARAGGDTGGARPCCRVLSLGRLLNGKQKNSIYSWQRTAIYF